MAADQKVFDRAQAAQPTSTGTSIETTAVVGTPKQKLAPALKVRKEFREAFRLLALSVRQLALKEGLQTILVMGAYPGEGRTTTVAQLGVALAERGFRVAVVEADTRRSPLARTLGVTSTPVAGPGGPQMTATPTTIEGLSLIRPPCPPEESPDGAAQVLSEFARDVDFVLLDSPPCRQSVGPYYLASVVDGVLYVVRRKRQQDAALQRSIQTRLAELGACVLGVVYNEG